MLFFLTYGKGLSPGCIESEVDKRVILPNLLSREPHFTFLTDLGKIGKLCVRDPLLAGCSGSVCIFRQTQADRIDLECGLSEK